MNGIPRIAGFKIQKLIDAGTDPIWLKGANCTFRFNYVDGSFNKGGLGNGYYTVEGEDNLIYADTVRNLRHFALHLGAYRNVIYKCDIETDVNFHDADLGYNLVQENRIIAPKFHYWEAFATGAPQYGHSPPGENNIIYNNFVVSKGDTNLYTKPGKIFTYYGFHVLSETNYQEPICKTFYPALSNFNSISEDPQENSKSKFEIFPNPTSAIVNIIITNSQSDINDVIVRNLLGEVINSSKLNYTNQINLSELPKGMYFIELNGFTKKLMLK